MDRSYETVHLHCIILMKSPRPGFEPGNPFGNGFSKPAQYQVVPSRHSDGLDASLFLPRIG